MGTERDAGADACPYVGLQPYREEDRAYFFGRERDIEAVIDNLYAARLTVYYGASGVGKSSVLMAGVVPALRCEPRTAVVVFREWQLDSAVARLKEAVVAAVARAGGKADALDALGPLDDLLLAAGAAINGTVLLLLDQFEEYFLYHPEADAAGFDAELARAVTRRDVDAGFLLSLREDALAKLDRFKTGIPNLLANRLRLEHLDRSAAEQAVRKPLERFASLPEAEGKPSRIEDALVERVIAETASGRVSLAQGAGAATAAADDMHVETPFLQLVLTRLWRAELSQGSPILRLQTLVDLGGAKTIVEFHLDGVMDKLSAQDQEICSRFFDRLVTPSGGKIACRLDDLTNWAGPDLAARVPGALARLAQERILRPVSGLPGQPPQYEIFHDVLAASILKWRDDFLKQARQSAEQEQALAAERQQRLEAEARAAKILRWAIGCVLVLLVVAAVGWYRADAEGGRLAISQFAAKANAAAAREPRTAAYFAVLAARDAQASAQVRRALYAALSVPIPIEFRACEASATAGGKVLRFGPLRSERPDHLGPTQEAIGLGCEDGVLRFYPLSGSGAVRELRSGATNAIVHVALSPDRARAVAVHDYGEVQVWDLSNPQAVAYKLPERAQPFSVGDDARFIATVEPFTTPGGRARQRVRVRDSMQIRDSRRGLIDELTAEDVEDVAISNDAAWLALRTSGGDIELCKRPGCSQKRRISGRSAGGFGGILFTPQTRLVAAGSEDEGELHIFNPAAAADMHEEALPSHSGLEGVYLAKDGRVAAVAESVRVWSPEHGLSNPAATAVGDFALSTDMRFAAIAGEAGITLWDYAAHRTLATLPSRATSYRELEFSPDGQTLAVLLDRGDEGPILQLWRLAELGAARTLAASEKKVEEVEFARDGSLLVATKWDASTWDISSGKGIRTVVGEARARTAGRSEEPAWADVAISAESMRLAAVAHGRPGVELWDMRSGEPLPLTELAGSSATDVRLDADGKVLAVGEADGRVSFFRIGEDHPRKIGEIPANGKRIKRVAFGSKAHVAVTFIDEPIDRIEVWSVERQPRKLFPPPGDAGKAQHLAFSPDGTRVAVSVADSVALHRLDPPLELASVRLNLELGGPDKGTDQAERAEERPREKIRRLAFSEDSRILALGGARGHVVLWRVPGTETRSFVRLGKRAQQGEIHTLAFSPDSKTILTTSGDDPTAKLWDTQTGEELQVLFSGDAAFTRAAFGEGKYLAAGRADGSVRLYPLELGELVRVAKDRLRMQPYTPEECRKHLEEECPALQ